MADILRDAIVLYRAYDARTCLDFSCESFREALERLQFLSNRSPYVDGSIYAYLRDGGIVVIPTDFYMCSQQIGYDILPAQYNVTIIRLVSNWLLSKTQDSKRTPLQAGLSSILAFGYATSESAASPSFGQVPTALTVLLTAQEVFGSKENALVWLSAASLALDGTKPIDLLQSRPQGILNLLSRIDYGVYT